MTPHFVQRLSGRCSSGAERGKGTRWHLTTADSSWATALCGAKPGRLSGAGFVKADDPNQAPTCPRCLKKIAQEHR